MKKIYLALLSALVFTISEIHAQCSITATANPLNVVCGDPVDLIVVNGFGQGAMVFEENFNSGAPTGWQSTSQATYTNPCSPGVDGTTHLWMGSAASVPRIMTTVGFDLSSAIAGATVCFDLLFARQGDAAPCEGPDEPNEGVFLQYSTNNGATWIDIHYFNPNGGNDPQLINWNNWCFSLPPDAISPNTQIRWAQTSDSGADYDHWGIDNVQIFFNDPDYTITWTHDGYTYPYASTGGTNPTPDHPQTTTTYTVEMTNGTFTCSSSVTVEVVQPTAAVSVERDTAICVGECVTLNADARIIKRPAKTPTYSNNNLTPIAVGFGSTTTLSIPINDLNMDDILPGSITSVCLNSVNFFGFNFIPPGQSTIGDLVVNLICPDGSSITLVPAGQTTSADPTQGYTNTCFVPTGGANIGSATPNYTGNFAPNQPFDNLVGCTANGNWTLEIRMNTSLGFGSGFFGGWNITFDDPEISYTGDFVWSPTTNMTGENTLTPTVCPTSEQVYTISVVDSAGCLAPTLADVTISIDPTCCPITFDAAITQPSCGSTDGSVTVTVLDGSGNYTYTWDVGGSSSTLSNIGTGSYTLTVYDIDLDCQRDTTIVLTALNSPVIDNIATTDETCIGDEDGSAQVTASGGTGTLTYSWSNGADVALIENLAPGNYTVTVSDDLGCEAIETIEIFEGPSCCDFTFSAATVQPTCNNADGSITLTVSNGSGNYGFNWSNGGNTSSISNVSAGSYSVTITDLDVTPLCQKDTTIEVSSSGVEIDNVDITNPSCDENNGTISVSIIRGIALIYNYRLNNGPFQSDSVFTNLSSGSYTVLVRDGFGCEDTTTVFLVDQPVFTIDANITNTTCNNADGSITLTVSNGSGNYGFNWSNGGNTSSISNVSAGSYSVTITDLDLTPLCQKDTTIVLSDLGAPTIDNISATNETCAGDNDGTVTVSASGGTGTLTYTWQPGNLSGASQTGLAPGNYTVTVEDADGCESLSSVTVAAGPTCCDFDFDLTTVSESCFGLDNGSAEVSVSGGTAPYTVEWNGVVGNNTLENLAPGNYTVSVTDADNCTETQTFVIQEGPFVEVSAGDDTSIFVGTPLQLNADVTNGTSGSFTWTPSADLSCNDCQSPVSTPLQNVVYTVVYNDDLGCSATDDVSVTVISDQPFCIFPDAFTPNNDNINDVFNGICQGMSFIEMRVYNRWGELVFQESGNLQINGWNGIYKGLEAPGEVYVFYVYIEYENGDSESVMGNVTLIR